MSTADYQHISRAVDDFMRDIAKRHAMTWPHEPPKEPEREVVPAQRPLCRNLACRQPREDAEAQCPVCGL